MDYEEIVVYLSDKAFIGIVISAVEAFKKETLGAVFGFITNHNEIIVEYAIPYQSAERKYVEVSPNWRRESKILGLLPEITHLDHIGYFHSHTEYGDKKPVTTLSDADINSMYEGHIELVIAIWQSKQPVRLGYSESSKELSFPINEGKYNLKITAYFKDNSGAISKCKIICPYVVGLYEPVKE